MKKVLMISGSWPPIACGVGYYAVRLSEEMAGQSLPMEILSTDGVDRQSPVPLTTVPDWRVRSIPKILAALDSSRAEIVHIQYPTVGYRRQLGINLLPYFIRIFKPHIRIVVTLHEYHQSRRLGRWRNRITITPAHKIIVSNESDARDLKKLRHKLSVIPIGSNIDVVKRNPEVFRKIMATLRLDNSKLTLLFFGYAFPEKNIEVLLDALSEPALAGCQLLMITTLEKDNEYHNRLESKVRQINENEKWAAVTGFLPSDEVSAVMQECRYFVLPGTQPLSAKAGSAIAAAQHGMIIVSHGSNDPAGSAPFEHMKNCYLLDKPTPKDVAEAIHFLESESKTAEAIRAGTKELGEYFAWPNIIGLHLKLYSEL